MILDSQYSSRGVQKCPTKTAYSDIFIPNKVELLKNIFMVCFYNHGEAPHNTDTTEISIKDYGCRKTSTLWASLLFLLVLCNARSSTEHSDRQVHGLFSTLSSWKGWTSIRNQIRRFRESIYPQVVRNKLYSPPTHTEQAELSCCFLFLLLF